MKFEIGFRVWSINYRSSRLFSQVEMTANKVGMKMSFKNIFDRSVVLLCHLQIRFCIPYRINYCGNAVALHKIRSFAQAAGIDLLNVHTSWFKIKEPYLFKGHKYG